MELTPVSQRFVLHWGEMGTRWGVNRTVAQIHALLFISGRAMCAEELAETLNVARSNVSNSLKELQGWKLIRNVHVLGDRRDHFETSGDVWELFRIIVAERQRREIEPTLQVLRECMESPEFKLESPLAQQRIRNTWQFMDTLTAWTREMLRLSTATLSKVLKMGAGIQKLLGRGAKTGEGE
ncbi:GbsR/MarR family transcriptional regulator [Chromobacterium violaceum]|uniref:GbsR/MarR family transcriptional regulator n=1 Tax=Chromobacterium violaceum TaxID=536 RepID=UPI0005D452FE|nr:MarR family transcriptional regulator [Chromobacterium violaceum]KJH66288.1 MarR family transcriptional regulator [Chromobacterium violaceum]OQS25322.1 MarR family transcriptional regulator [Chromobacterium violaceum]QIY81655.1 MarR family transcriptional regulator [Chromobacterium violaceum]